MERCPNCGGSARPGAKFCTTCGFRFTGDDGGESVSETNEDTATAEASNGGDNSPIEANNGWPTAVAPESSQPSSGWGFVPESSAANADVASAGEPSPAPWSVASADPWPAPPNTEATRRDWREFAAETVAVDAADDAASEEMDAERVADQTRALRLLDELRASITSLGQGAWPEAGGVISDLEVALTPPAALQADALGALREALQTARERPRDLDAIVGLTQRLDTIAALVVAYDRAIAAIERSLDVLKSRGVEESGNRDEEG
jgi:hypothetical protein